MEPRLLWRTALVALVCAWCTEAAEVGKGTTLHRGLVSYWSFDEGAGSQASDKSGTDNHGILKGFKADSGWTKGRVGSALKFDGIDDHILIPDSKSVADMGQAFTISMWLKPLLAEARPFAPMVVMSKGDPTKPGGSLRIFYDEPTRVVDDVFAPAGFYVAMRKAKDDDADPELNYVGQAWPCAMRDRWYHFTLVFDGKAERPASRIYADGVEMNQKEYVTEDGAARIRAVKANDVAMEIGGLNGGANFCGLMDEVKIWSRALPPAEIQAEFRRAGPPPPPTLELFANFNSIGVTARVSPASDPEGDAVAGLEYRQQGQARYRKGFPPSRIIVTGPEYGNGGTRAMYIGSIFWAEQDTTYDVKLALSDPTTKGVGSLDGVVLTGSVRTRAEKEIVTPAPVHTYYVSPKGSGKAFSVGQPGLLKEALAKAQPGEHVVLNGGTYYEGLLGLARPGEPGKPIVVKGAPNETAILDGSEPEALAGWAREDGATYRYRQALDRRLVTSRLVVAGGRRLIQYTSLEKLKAFKPGRRYTDRATPAPGFFIDDATAMLYVNLGGPDPNTVEMRISRYHHALKLSRVDHVHVENLTFRYYNLEPRITPEYLRRLQIPLWRWKGYTLREFKGPPNVVPTSIWYDYDYPKALFIDSSSYCVVRKCRFRLNKVGLCILGRSYRTVIEDNEFSDTTGDLGFHKMKATRTELGAGPRVHSPYSGRGLVIRRNVIHDTGDGFQVCGFNASPLNLAGVSDEADVHDNLVYNSSDDSLEVDGIACNVRVWNNVFRDGLTGVSLSPTRHGPVYVIRNIAYETEKRLKSVQPMERMMKVLSWGQRGPMFLIHNTSYAGAGFEAIGRGLPRITWDLLYARNNLYYSKRGKGFDVDLTNKAGGPTSLDYDNYFCGRGDPLLLWNGKRVKDMAELRSASGQEQHGLSVDPKFADPEKGTFRLQPDSPVIDRGSVIPGINDCGPHKYKGEAPDVGAMECK